MLRFIVVVAMSVLFNEPAIGQTLMPSKTGVSHSAFLPPNATSTANATTPAPTWPTASFPTFPPEFSDIPKDTLACWESWGNYMLRRTAPNPGILTSPTTFISPSTYPTPSYRTDNLRITYAANQTDIPVGLTTLCDGVPRASFLSHIIDYSTSWYNYTFTYSTTYISSTITGVTKSGYEVVKPTCTVAPNDSPLCARINSAYTWWLSSSASGSALPTGVARTHGDLAMPSCWHFIPTPPGSKPTCAAYATHGWEVHYWPTPTPTGSDFCNSSWTPVTPTPTIPGRPNTAVVKGKTLTSPSIYHFLTSVDVFTLAGTRTIADPNIFLSSPSVWAPYTPSPSPTSPIITVAQLEKDILSVTSAFSRKANNYKWSFSKDFRVNDVFTMREGPWLGQVNRPLPIFQEEYVPHLALELEELEGVSSGCVWVKTSTKRYLGEVHLDGKVQKTDFHAIVTPTAAAEGVVTAPTIAVTGLTKEN